METGEPGEKPPPDPKSLATFPLGPAMWDLNPDGGERQIAVSAIVLDRTAIRVGPSMYQHT